VGADSPILVTFVRRIWLSIGSLVGAGWVGEIPSYFYPISGVVFDGAILHMSLSDKRLNGLRRVTSWAGR